MIYFVKVLDDGPIKIGYTARDVAQRARELPTDIRHPIRLLASMLGSWDYEQALHRRFADRCVSYELFVPEGPVQVFMEEHATPWTGRAEFSDGAWYERNEVPPAWKAPWFFGGGGFNAGLVLKWNLSRIGYGRLIGNGKSVLDVSAVRERLRAFGTGPEVWENLQRQWDERT